MALPETAKMGTAILAMGCPDGKVQLLDPHSAYVGADLALHTRAVLSVAVSCDGRLIASASADGTACVWDVRSGQVRCWLRQHNGKGECRCAVDDETGLVQDQNPMCFVTGLLGEVTSVAFSADSRLLCTGDSGGQLILWGASEGTLKRRFLIGRGKRILSVAFSREGDRVASSALDEGHGRRAPPPPEDEWHSTQLWVIQVWNVETGEVVRTLEQLRTAPTDVEFSPGGRQLSCGDRKDVHIFNVDPSMKLKRFTHTVIRNLKHPKAVSAAAWSPDGSLLASGCEDWALRVWDMQSASQRWLAWGHDGKHGCLCPSQRRGGPPNPACPFQGHRARVCKVMWSADCRTVGSVSDDGAIKLWDVASGVHLSTCLPLYDPRLSSFSLGPDPLAARRLAIAMGFHDRLGAASRIHVLDPAVAQMFLEI